MSPVDRQGGEAPRMWIGPDGEEIEVVPRRIVEDVREVYGIVYGMLTDLSKDMDWDERCARAANEVAAAHDRLSDV